MAQVKARDTMVKIPEKELPNMLSKKVHIGWADARCVWVLTEIDKERRRAKLVTPRSGKVRWEEFDQLYYTRQTQPE